MRTMMILAMLSAPAWAGGIRIVVSDAHGNQEALQNHAVMVAEITACLPGAKTTMSATAEGMVDGVRKSVPLKVMALKKQGTFAVAREWPQEGKWAVIVVANYLERKGFTSSVIVPADKDSFQWDAMQEFYHVPTNAEVAAVLSKESVTRASIN